MSSSFSQKTAAIVLLLAGLWLGSRFLLPIAVPFLLAFLLCLLTEPLVRRLQKPLGRTAAAGIGITLGLILGIGLVVTLCAAAVRQLGALAGVVPDLEDSAAYGMASLEDFCLGLAAQTPQSISPLLTRGVENVFSDGSRILDRILTALLNLATDIVKALPDSALGIGTWVLASYMLSARLPHIRAWFSRQLPQTFQERYLPALKRVRHTIGAWLLAQAKLMGITFCVLTVGLFLLRIHYFMLWALLIAFLDALPILGTGTVLVPWALVCLLQGNYIRALGLLGVYAVAALLRSVLEPRLLGKQLGLDPLVTLIALYAGYRIWGFGGMIVAPLLAVTAIQLAQAANTRS